MQGREPKRSRGVQAARLRKNDSKERREYERKSATNERVRAAKRLRK